MTNMPYEERIKNRDNDWYYNKCICQYHFIIKSEWANRRYKEEIARLNKIIDELEEYIQLKIIRSENESDYIIDEGDIKELYYKLQELKEKE